MCRIPRADNRLTALFFVGEFEVEGEEFFEQVVVRAKALSLQHEGIKLFVQFVELASGFIEVGVVEFGDAHFAHPFDSPSTISISVKFIAVPRSIKYTRYPLQSCLDYESVLNLSGHRYI